MPRRDIAESAELPLKTTMAPAAEAGLIARHYATAYRDMFEDLLPNLRKARGRHARREIAITGPHLCILATSPASHVRRQRRSVWRRVSDLPPANAGGNLRRGNLAQAAD